MADLKNYCTPHNMGFLDGFPIVGRIGSKVILYAVHLHPAVAVIVQVKIIIWGRYPSLAVHFVYLHLAVVVWSSHTAE